MAINSVAIQSFEQVALNRTQTNPGAAQRSENADPLAKAQDAQSAKSSQNSAILQAHYNISIKAGEESNTLMFKTAIDAINKELEPILGEKNAAEKAFDNSIDFSPEAVADRIVGFATSFFSLYQQQNQDKELETQLNDFLDIVGGGVDKGFGEAKDILDGLGVFEGEVEENANKTYDLIFSGFDKFKESVIEANKPVEEPIESSLS